MPSGEAEPDQLARLFARLFGEWEKLGQSEPYWSVLTDERYRSARIEEHRAAFFASGGGEVALLRAALARNGLAIPDGAIGIELGCGVGRVTVHLAALLRGLYALDISAGNLAEAERALAERGIGNVALAQVTRVEDYDALPEFDLFVSGIALQHSPPPVIRRVLERVAARGRPGALASFQIVTYGEGYAFEIESYLRTPAAGMEVHALAQPAVFELFRAAGWRVVEVIEDNAAGGAQWLSQNWLLRRG
jgi:SAM-dependent methyltransferase